MEPKKLREAIRKAQDVLAKRFELIGQGIDPNFGKGLRYENIRKDLLDRYVTLGFRSLKYKLNEETGEKEPTVWGIIHLDQFFAGWKVTAITQAAIRAFVERQKRPRRGRNGQSQCRAPAIHVQDRTQVRQAAKHPGIPGATEGKSPAAGIL